MNIMIVDIKARHKYRTILFGNLYMAGRCMLGGFLRNIGRFEEYEPEVSREDAGEEE